MKYSTKYFCNSEPWWEASAGDEIWQDPYTKFNAYVNIQPTDGAWSLNLYGKNLTETEVKNLVGWSKNLESTPLLYGATLTVNF